MKLVWCPEIACKAFIDTVKALSKDHEEEGEEETSVAELISAMAGGWNARLIVETWPSSSVATSVGLGKARAHTGGRHVCVVGDERAAEGYKAAGGAAEEVVVGEAEEAMGAAEAAGVDFLVVGNKEEDAERLLRAARFGERGAVVVCGGGGGGGRWRSVVEGGARVVRTAYLPVGAGVEIAHVGAAGGGGGGGTAKNMGGGRRRWFRHVDEAGEEHVFRR